MTSSDPPALRLYRPDRPAMALGLAVAHLQTKPAFASLPFGEWSKILVGQINRKHYCFVIDGGGAVVGFVGWALATREKAEAWVEGRPLSYEDSLAGECLIFNAWSADTKRIHRFLVDEVRKLISDKEVLYFMRHYPNGATRPVRLSVNAFVRGHVERRGGHATPAG